MKALTLAALTLSLFTAQAAQACMILPKGDSQIRTMAIHDTIGNNEQLAGFRKIDQDVYEVEVTNFSSDETETRVYRVQNTSPMCPKYKATRIK